MRFSNSSVPAVLIGLMGLLGISLSSGCTWAIFYNPSENPDSTISRSDCGYDPYYGYYCFSESGEAQLSRDVTTSVAEAERARVEVTARHYSSRFHLSADQGIKIAKTIRDYNALATRSEQDVADVARRLYGLDPRRVVSAVRDAQLGDSALLNEVVSEAARNFDTSPETMREIVKTLHGAILRQQGIAL